MRKTVIAVIVTLAATALVAPATVHASPPLWDAKSVWYWSPERAAAALEASEPDVATRGDGAFCGGRGASIAGHYRSRLYRKFRCDVYATSGRHLGTGTIKPTGQALRRYRWVAWNPA